MSQPIRAIREQRRDLLMVLTTAVLLALSISFAVAYFSQVFEQQPLVLLALGGVFLLAAIVLLAFFVFDAAEHTVRLRGAVAYEADGVSIRCVPIIGYRFNNEVCEYLRAFLNENAAYAKIFSERVSSTAAREAFDPDELNHETIINSVLEFSVLHQLELHLNSYFVDNEIEKSRIVSLGREQLDASVLKNRVLDQLSKDMTERAAFANEDNSSGEPSGVVYYSTNQDGVVYQRVDVELPPGSKIYRNESGFLVISNRVFKLVVSPQYQGFVTSISPQLMPTRGDAKYRAPLLVKIDLRIRIKRMAIFSGSSMEMYQWLDSFVERMRDFVSIERLEGRLDPDLIKIIRGRE